MNLFAYGSPTLADLAAAYAFGVVKAHAFVDGNKRTALVTALTFLRLNGYGFRPETREGLEDGRRPRVRRRQRADFAGWLADGIKPLGEAQARERHGGRRL